MFRQVETQGRLSDGRLITRTISDPRGISYTEYRKLDVELVVAFGLLASVTKGTYHGDHDHART